MFAEELSTERSRVSGDLDTLAGHAGVYEIVVLDYDGDFGVVTAELRAVIEICGTTNYGPIICYEDFTVDVKFYFDLVFRF